MHYLVKGALALAGRHAQGSDDYSSPGCGVGYLVILVMMALFGASCVVAFNWLTDRGFGELAYLFAPGLGVVSFLIVLGFLRLALGIFLSMAERSESDPD